MLLVGGGKLKSLIYKEFGLDFDIEEVDIKGLKVYMKVGRKFYKASSNDISFLIVRLSDKDSYGANALKKQVDEYRRIVDMNVVFLFERISKLQRNALIEKRIPFIANDTQLYLPFIGIVFDNHFEKEIKYEKMMPSTQCVFLYLLYNGQKEKLQKNQIAEKLNITKMSVTRASEQLKKMNLIVEESNDKNGRYMKTVATKKELVELARQYMINPIQKKIFVEESTFIKDFVSSSESGLSKKTMLNDSGYTTYALYKKDELVKKMNEVDPKWQEDKKIIGIELWKYDPKLFAADGVVDPISLAMTMEDNEDERVEGALEEYLEEFEW